MKMAIKTKQIKQKETIAPNRVILGRCTSLSSFKFINMMVNKNKIIIAPE
jgi:hypothetical protein